MKYVVAYLFLFLVSVTEVLAQSPLAPSTSLRPQARPATIEGVSSGTLQGYLGDFARFLSDIILPTLFAIAFLVFLINIVRYFIIGGANEADREKAKRSALYGVVAFVLLFTTWTIVNLLLNGLQLSQSDEAGCPDYITAFGGGECDSINRGGMANGTFPTPTPGSGSSGSGSGIGTGSGSGSGSNGGSGIGTGSGSGSGSNTNESTVAPLAELVFGTGKDTVSARRTLINSSAQASTPTINSTASCVEGMNTLQLSAELETNQAAYLYYQNENLQWRWVNITDTHSGAAIGYDQDILDAIIATANTKNFQIIHTHPAKLPKNLNLSMNGHGPSTADFMYMCTLNNSNIRHVVVDEKNVWSYQQRPDTCPYTLAARAQLPTLETYLALSSVATSTRPLEVAKYIDSNLTAFAYDEEFRQYSQAQLLSFTAGEIRALSQDVQATASTTVNYYPSSTSFCASL